VLYCSGSMCVGVTVWFGWAGVSFAHTTCFTLHTIALDKLPHNITRCKAYGIPNAQNKACKMLNGSYISLMMTVTSRNMSH
jgi:hypothetical protein